MEMIKIKALCADYATGALRTSRRPRSTRRGDRASPHLAPGADDAARGLAASRAGPMAGMTQTKGEIKW
jgi:hypothetical protein